MYSQNDLDEAVAAGALSAEAAAALRNYVDSHQNNVALLNAYNDAVVSLSGFRDKHIQIVTRYIILPSRQPWKKPEDKRAARRKNLASSSTAQR